MDFDVHNFTLIGLGILGAALWRFYSLIIQRIEEKFSFIEDKVEQRFNHLEEKISRHDKNFDEIKSDIKEIKAEIRVIEQKVSDMDKQIAILQVNIHHIYLIPKSRDIDIKNNPGSIERL